MYLQPSNFKKANDDVRSMLKRQTKLSCFYASNNTEFFLITKSWLDDSITSSAIDVVREDRQLKGGGCIAIYVFSQSLIYQDI